MPSRRRSDLSPQRRHPITEAIANRAYELFLARGGEHGHALDDWLKAEQEVLEDINGGAAAGKRSTVQRETNRVAQPSPWTARSRPSKAE
jgi:hypothetical protein